MFAKVVRRDVFASLPENRMACSGVELMVIGNGQRLSFPRLVDASHFDMAAALPHFTIGSKLLAPKSWLGVRSQSRWSSNPVARIAAPAKDLTQNNGGEPDPEGRIHRDNRPLIQIESVIVPSTGGIAGSAARVHLLLRPNRSVQAHWNNESDPLVVWIDPPAGWKLTASHHSVPNAPQAISDEIRRIEFEVKSEGARQLGAATFRGYALYYVCEGVNGTCLYRRQDLNITLNRPVPKDSAVHP